MRWVKIDTSVNGIFSREVCPEDSEYLLAHMDTFKCMWHEQTRNYWVRMIISLREYVRKHIFTYESLERLGAPVPIFEMIIEYAYINICANFAEDSFGKAKEFLRAIISVCANRDMMCQIGARPLSNDPFYNKFTRDFYRTVFGQPSSTLKLQLQTYIATPLYARFAAGVVALIKQWVQVTDCSLKDFFQKFHTHPYWTYPDDYCPQKVLFKYIEDKFYGWESPDCQEVEDVMNRAPDRETSFAEVVELLPADFADYGDVELSDCSSEGSEDSFCPYGIKQWSDIVFGVSDQLIFDAPFHVRELCSTCMGVDSSDYTTDEELSDSDVLLKPEEVEKLCNGLKYDHKVWRHPKVIALLDTAEKRYRDRMLDKLTGVTPIGDSGSSNNKTVPSQRKGKKSRKKPRDTVSIAFNLTAPPASSRQPAFMKNGAVPPSTSRPEIINLEENGTRCAQLAAALERFKIKIESNETAPIASSEQQAGNTSNVPKPQEAAKKAQKAPKSQEGTKSQGAAKAPDKPPLKKAEDKKPLAGGDAAASKAVGPSKKGDKIPLVNGDAGTSKAVGASKKVNKKPLVNGDADVSKVLVRKCATCGKSEGVKLKKCSLCVQKKMDPAYYCSRECQTEDWDNHQTVHMDDTD
uniref:MYND-type domain-containing protein n=1 Tax=Amblyomma aureolatum TaxID=187763 RepID=A0A1E1XCC6_9ACAR